MSTHNQIDLIEKRYNYDVDPDLIEFPAKSAEEHKLTKDFFTNVFGWQYKDWGDDYSDTHDSGLTSGIVSAEDNRQSMPLTVIYSKNLEETKEKIITEGGKIIADIYSFPGGRRFHFTDPSGNELAVWSE